MPNWERLKMHYPLHLLQAPLTCGDPSVDAKDLPEQTVNLLISCANTPWSNHLVLGTLMGHREHLANASLLVVLKSLNKRFRLLFNELHISSMNQFNADDVFPRYMTGELVSSDSKHARTAFLNAYNSLANKTSKWMLRLTDHAQKIYAPYQLVKCDDVLLYRKKLGYEVLEAGRKKRKLETDAIVPHYADLRALAHFRYNKLSRLRSAYTDLTATLSGYDDPRLPLTFRYDEGGSGTVDDPFVERLHFMIWSRRSFVLAHADQYDLATLRSVERQTLAFAPEREHYFLEYTGAESLLDPTSPPEGLWFAEMHQLGLIGAGTSKGTPEEIDARLKWLREWGYDQSEDDDEQEADSESTDTPQRMPVPFLAHQPGLLSEGRSVSPFLGVARTKTSGMLFTIGPYYAAALFGLAAVETFSKTGIRIMEFMQIRLTAEGLVQVEIPAPPEAEDQTPLTRVALRMVPKGAQDDALHDFYIDDELLRLMAIIGGHLKEHYNLTDDDLLPEVGFYPRHPSAHRFGRSRYLFQYQGRHISDQALRACMRFLMHGMSFRTAEGKLVVVRAHALRHALATYAVQVLKISVEVVAEWYGQSNLEITRYYSQATRTMAADAALRTQRHLTALMGTSWQVLRVPAEFQEMVNAAEQKVGTLANVLGGECTSHGYCPSQTQCVGCPAKAVSPKKRAELLKHREWLVDAINYHKKGGRMPEAYKLESNMRDTDKELKEMDMIEYFQSDELRPAKIELISLESSFDPAILLSLSSSAPPKKVANDK